MAARTIVAQPIPSAGKHIRFDRLTKDYAMYLDGQYIGSRAAYDEAETELDRVATEQARQLAADLADEAAERDILDVDLDALRTVVEGGIVVGALAALVSSGAGLLARGTLPIPITDPCCLCGTFAALTLVLGSGETLRLCRPCYRAGWARNSANTETWTALWDQPLPGDAPGDDRPETGPVAEPDDVVALASWSTAPARKAVACA